jgi:hypothetical protein
MAEVVVTYRDPEAARRAITTLERHGVDAANIHLVDAPGVRTPKTDEAQNEPDMAVTRAVGSRSAAASIVVAIALGAIGGVVGWFVSGGEAGGTIAGALGGFIVGGIFGFLYGGYSGIAVSDEWGETFEASGPATLAVTVDDDQVIDLRERLESTHPDHIAIS